MLTVADVVDRVFRDWLYPPDFQPTQSNLIADLEVGDTTLHLDTYTVTPEELMLLGGGSIIEVGTEQMIVQSVEDSTGEVTLSARGTNNTDEQEHKSGSAVLFNPTFTRKSVFDTVSDTIVSYYPDLYAIRTTDSVEYSSSNGILEIPSDAHIPVSLYANHGGRWERINFDHHPNFPGVHSHNALFTPGASSSASHYLTYHGPLYRPASENDALSTLGFRDEWTKLLTVSTVIHLIGSRDIDTISQTHIAQVLQAEYQASRSTSIRRDMLQYENMLMERAKSSLYAQSNIPMQISRGF